MTNATELTAKQARSLWAYDPETGVLTWRTGRTRGRAAGAALISGYLRVTYAGRVYAAHRLVWLLWTGRWPTGALDHLNGDRADNRIANLREATYALNNQNQRRAHRDNPTGLLGVSVDKRCPRRPYKATIHHDGETVYLGSFATPEEAHQRYLRAKRVRHPGSTL